ncbi:Biofilm associated protein, partial [Acinetobacter baumannii]|nr:Biofilm associated protein [Acinetobacter baumannii]
AADDHGDGENKEARPERGEGEVGMQAEEGVAEGDVEVGDGDVTVAGDTVPAGLIGTITIPEDLNGEGILNADELGTDGSFNAQVALGPDALDGTVVNVTGLSSSEYKADLANGYITAAIPVTCEGPLAIPAAAGDAQGHVGAAASEATVTV